MRLEQKKNRRTFTLTKMWQQQHIWWPYRNSPYTFDFRPHVIAILMLRCACVCLFLCNASNYFLSVGLLWLLINGNYFIFIIYFWAAAFGTFHSPSLFFSLWLGSLFLLSMLLTQKLVVHFGLSHSQQLCKRIKNELLVNVAFCTCVTDTQTQTHWDTYTIFRGVWISYQWKYFSGKMKK